MKVDRYLLIERIRVQNANAVAGFTWGFPAVTHFLGFTHNLTRKLNATSSFHEITLNGCGVIAHEANPHTYKAGSSNSFTQYRGTRYLSSTTRKEASEPPPVVEEAKMNMTVSLLIPVAGYLGGNFEQEKLIEFIKNASFTQRLAGGTILNINSIELVDLSDKNNIKFIRRKLLPVLY